MLILSVIFIILKPYFLQFKNFSFSPFAPRKCVKRHLIHMSHVMLHISVFPEIALNHCAGIKLTQTTGSVLL